MQRNGGSRATVAVVMGGNSAEREISIQSGTQVLRALHALGYEAQSLDYDDRFVDALRELKPDVAFIALHGPGRRRRPRSGAARVPVDSVYRQRPGSRSAVDG